MLEEQLAVVDWLSLDEYLVQALENELDRVREDAATVLEDEVATETRELPAKDSLGLRESARDFL